VGFKSRYHLEGYMGWSCAMNEQDSDTEKGIRIKIRKIYMYIYRVIQKDGFNFVRLYFLNYTWYVNDLHNI